jgi:hypothetical protein
MQMDKASVVKDAIDYIQQLQKQEREMLAEISILESTATHGHLLGTVVLPDSGAYHAVPPLKKMRTLLPSSTAATSASAMAASSRRIEDLEVNELRSVYPLIINQ